MVPANSTASSPRSVAAMQGLEWFIDGWRLFSRTPGPWIAQALLLLVVMAICNALPVLGNLLSPFAYSVFAAATLHASQRARHAASTTLLDDMLGFGSHPALKPVLVLAAICLGLTLGAAIVAGLVIVGLSGVGALMASVHDDSWLPTSGLIAGMLPGLLLLLLATLTITAMYWFALPDVVFGGTEPWTAMRRSLRACIGNVVPLLVFGVLGTIAATIAMIPFGLGLLVLMPVLFAAWLVSYEDIYGAAAQPPAPPA